MRVQAYGDVATIIQRDGENIAMRHAQKEPDEGVSGNRILSLVKIPTEAVVVTGGSVGSNEYLVVAALHVQPAGWLIVKHQVQLVDAVTHEIRKASVWTVGPWQGDSVLSADFDPTLPPEANPA